MSENDTITFPDTDYPDDTITLTVAESIAIDYANLHQDLLTERELRTNAQNERDAYRALLARVLSVDEACTGEGYAALIAEMRGVVEAGA